MSKKLVLALAILGFSSCMKDESVNQKDLQGKPAKVEFSVGGSQQTPIIRSSSRNSDNTELQGIAVKVVVENQNGEEVLNKVLTLRTFGTTQITEPVDLLTGDYKLTEFHLLDKNGKVIASTPKSESKMANFVNNPLDIDSR